MIPLSYYIMLSSALFCVGVFGIVTKRNAVSILMSVELVMNSANINLVAFSVYRGDATGQVFAIFSIAIAAAEAAVGLAIYLVVYKTHTTVDVREVSVLRW